MSRWVLTTPALHANKNRFHNFTVEIDNNKGKSLVFHNLATAVSRILLT